MAARRKFSLHEPCKPICDSNDVQREFSTAADRYPTFFLGGVRHELCSNGVCTTAELCAACSLGTPRRQAPNPPMEWDFTE